MDEIKVLDIKESGTVGRWVLATIGGYDDSVSYELTFAPDIALHEWCLVTTYLPKNFVVMGLQAVGGELLGRKRALMAMIT